MNFVSAERLACLSLAPRRGPARGSRSGFRRTQAASRIRAKPSAGGTSQAQSRQLCMVPHIHPDLYLHPYLRALGRAPLAKTSAFLRPARLVPLRKHPLFLHSEFLVRAALRLPTFSTR